MAVAESSPVEFKSIRELYQLFPMEGNAYLLGKHLHQAIN